MADNSEVKKINDDLSKELVQKHDLKKIQVVEKIVLPTKEDLVTEKVYEKTEGIKKEIEENSDLIKKKLNHVKVCEKNPLPTKEQIEEEKKIEQESKKD